MMVNEGESGNESESGNEGENENRKIGYTLTITDEIVQIEHPKHKTEKVRWDEIHEIWMVTTDDGPVVSDIFMVLIGMEGGCVIPAFDCEGYDQVFDIVSKYKNFNFENYIASMSCAYEERFVVWKKDAD
jgi:hypothetical protein